MSHVRLAKHGRNLLEDEMSQVRLALLQEDEMSH
jgi:hypothetical protein